MLLVRRDPKGLALSILPHHRLGVALHRDGLAVLGRSWRGFPSSGRRARTHAARRGTGCRRTVRWRRRRGHRREGRTATRHSSRTGRGHRGSGAASGPASASCLHQDASEELPIMVPPRTASIALRRPGRPGHSGREPPPPPCCGRLSAGVRGLPHGGGVASRDPPPPIRSGTRPNAAAAGRAVVARSRWCPTLSPRVATNAMTWSPPWVSTALGGW